ncbi:hypothetical protein TcasGA2_TC007980 [Tribolium castaneum]|uniref:Uncharacterized protein n=1 Tax=Tribolium castaneum TaxID=7070 RepID=D2A3G7_TRICA|nr:hypothetical protein TcasGA2_TC007980 [Tribolium castaneum]
MRWRIACKLHHPSAISHDVTPNPVIVFRLFLRTSEIFGMGHFGNRNSLAGLPNDAPPPPPPPPLLNSFPIDAARDRYIKIKLTSPLRKRNVKHAFFQLNFRFFLRWGCIGGKSLIERTVFHCGFYNGGSCKVDAKTTRGFNSLYRREVCWTGV